MARTLDMKFIRYLNLFGKITKVRTQHCFIYNATIVFLVPQQDVAKAIGESGKNIRKLSEILEKKVKIITIPSGIEDIEKFILDIIYPIKFKSIEIKEDRLVISAGLQSRAALIGRNKSRLNEMKEILQQYFGIKDIRIA
jgi:NusA-like KH domain protein